MRAIVEGAEAGSCELNIKWTIERSERERKRLDAGSWVAMTGALALFSEEDWDGTTAREEVKGIARFEVGVAARERTGVVVREEIGVALLVKPDATRMWRLELQ